MQEQSRYENTGYAAMWGLLFAAPLLSLYIRTMHDSSVAFNWQEVFIVWRQFAVYLVLFLIHNFILAPLLIFRHKRWLYALLTLCMVALFAFYQCNRRPDFMRHQRPPMEREFRGPVPKGETFDSQNPEHNAFDSQNTEHNAFENKDFDHEPPPFEGHNRQQRRHNVPPVFIGQHDIIAIVILILMCGMNLGVKLYFKSRNDQKKLLRLEQENLQQQLEYLKYQINPHFFMNTLNNIHALVDIDPAKAQETILELSKMMRYVLYEGNKEGAPLSKELEFIRTYIHLMRLRYTDKVKITTNMPKELVDKKIPPLMLITFIENAFKHGISYQHESFIDINIRISNDRLHFTCQNSKADKPNEEKGGVGLANVKKRLNLLYDNNYTLNIEDKTDIYNVELTIPLNSSF